MKNGIVKNVNIKIGNNYKRRSLFTFKIDLFSRFHISSDQVKIKSQSMRHIL